MRVQIRHDRTEYVEKQKILYMDIWKKKTITLVSESFGFNYFWFNRLQPKTEKNKDKTQKVPQHIHSSTKKRIPS